MRPRARPLTLVPQPEPTELEQALAAVEESLGEPPDRRRTALDALALAAPDADLARGARDLAWSEEAPAPAAMRLLAQKTRAAAR
jgi:hypothetical protein